MNKSKNKYIIKQKIFTPFHQDTTQDDKMTKRFLELYKLKVLTLLLIETSRRFYIKNTNMVENDYSS